ncbi:MAG: hypothetical protein ACU0DW_10330 [Shimia sp.]
MTSKASSSILALSALQVGVLAPLTPALADAQDPWALIGDVTTAETAADATLALTKLYPAGMDGDAPTFELTGYVQLMWAGAETAEFILLSDMGFCPWCGETSHGAAVPVTLKVPADALEDGARITLRGALDVVADEAGTTTRMVDATIL